MGQMNQKSDKIFELFFEYPNKRFSVREIARKTRIPSSSVQRYLEGLRKKGFVDKQNRLIINSYTKFLKSFFMIDKIYSSKLLEYLEKMLVPESVIVFGSIRKGEYDFESDIDLFVESSIKKDLDLRKFEKKLKHKVQLFVYSDINKLQPHLLNNVVNGIKLSGYFKVKQ